MISTIDEQLISLIMSLFTGIAVGLLFDLYRVITSYIRPSKAFLYFTDLLFWIVTAIEAFAILLNADFAAVRLYTFAGMGIGMFIYFKLFSEYIIKFYKGTIYVICKIFRLCFMLLLLPVKFLRSMLWNAVNYVKNKVSCIVKSINEKSHVYPKKYLKNKK